MKRFFGVLLTVSCVWLAGCAGTPSAPKPLAVITKAEVDSVIAAQWLATSGGPFDKSAFTPAEKRRVFMQFFLAYLRAKDGYSSPLLRDCTGLDHKIVLTDIRETARPTPGEKSEMWQVQICSDVRNFTIKVVNGDVQFYE